MVRGNKVDKTVVVVAKKRTFLIFMVANWLLFLITTFVLWYIAYPGLQVLHPWLPMVAGIVFIIFHAVFMLGFGLILLSIICKGEVPLSQRLRNLVLKLYLPLTLSAPLTIMARKLLNISKDYVQRSFIEVNNHLIRTKSFCLTPQQLLLLLPQCLQRSDCKIRLVQDILSCKQCGNCQIKDVIQICQQYGIKAWVATGGRLARKIIEEQKPQAIIAVACERELVDGIRDCYPLPVFAILNQRPYGPCMDTTATLDRVKSAIAHFLAAKEPARSLLAVEKQREQLV
jgi:hypothetical protein